LAREKVVGDDGKQMRNGAGASWKKLGSSLFTRMFHWREHATLLEPRLFLGAAFYS